MNATQQCGGLFVAGLLIGGAIMTAVIWNAGDRDWKREAIKHNAAHYNQTTGVFEWNEKGESK